MKAILMSAGLGTRLHPITTHIPKCMVLIKGVPLLGWWLKMLKKAGMTEVIINLHYLPEQVVNYVTSQEWELKIHFSYEPKLLGSQGTLEANAPLLKTENSFLVVYADNLTDINLIQFIDSHRRHRLVATMALFTSANPQSCGIARLNSDQVIIEFEEKPAAPKSNLANAGIYMFNDTVWNYINVDKQPSDIGFDLLPRLVGCMSGFPIDGFFMDIGTVEMLQLANRSWNYDY